MRWGLLILGLLCGSCTAWAGQQVGENSAYAREQGLRQLFFYVAAGNGTGQIQYICRSFTGDNTAGATSASIWQVSQFAYDSSNRISTILYAGGSDNFTNICDNRTTLSYS